MKHIAMVLLVFIWFFICNVVVYYAYHRFGGSIMATAAPPAPPVTGIAPAREKMAAPPAAPEGYIGLSDLGRKRGKDAYETLRPFVGQRIAFQSVQLDDLEKPTKGTASVRILTDEGEKWEPTTIVLPKSALRAMAYAVQHPSDQKLSAFVMQTKRGIALR
jgi:hypothetical protein